MLMKGKTDTPTLLKAVLDADTGLRTGRVLSHVAVVEMPTYPRLMLWTDGGLNIRPNLEMRLDIIRNAVEFAGKLGIGVPNVALLSAMEKVNPKMEETVDYERIVTLQREAPFVDAVVEGPVAMDVALSPESARIKEIETRIAGATDVFVTPEISTCNIAVKGLIYLAGAKASGLVLGARVPIVLLSRSDDAQTKHRSIALGAIWS
jgi:phosphate butyryltransferase